MAILVVLTLTYALSLQERGRDTTRKNDLHNLQDSLEAYYNDNNSYPSTLAPLLPGYFQDQIPVDPRTAAAYEYEPAPAGCSTEASDCTGWTMSADLENDNDPAAQDGAYIVESLN